MEALSVQWLRQQLVTGPGGLWASIAVVPETGSTNTDLATAARGGAAEGTVLAAEHQRDGRGRAGRGWSSPPGSGLTVSVLLRPGDPAPGTGWPPAPPARWSWLSLLTGVALAEAVVTVAGVPATLKWPNDLLVGGGKGGGILAEVVGDAVVLGVGLNVTAAPPVDTGALPATSLQGAGAHTTDRGRILAGLLRRLELWYVRWRQAGGDPDLCRVRAAYQQLCATVGEPVRVLLPTGSELTGTAERVDHDGRLVVRDPAGAVHVLATGDVRHVRMLHR